ncbi:MAG: hypothetical protein HY402_05940 [Elusimicrobia bacterium]|nr:hypothetical protein [Elusimicrobiota bacterium]
MREVADATRIREFMRALGRCGAEPTKIYLTGGATAVLIGWRSTTIDVDLKIVPERESLLRTIPALKESLQINVEFAAPDQFVPPLAGWESRSPFIAQEERLSFFHYDLYSQALAKLERSHQQDLVDVQAMLKRQLIDPGRLRTYYEEMEPQLYRYPAVDVPTFRKSLEELLGPKT